jgi:hypothetical protein
MQPAISPMVCSMLQYLISYVTINLIMTCHDKIYGFALVQKT